MSKSSIIDKYLEGEKETILFRRQTRYAKFTEFLDWLGEEVAKRKEELHDSRQSYSHGQFTSPYRQDRLPSVRC